MSTAPLGPVTTTDYHTGGEPFRIVTGGVPELVGRTVLERRRYAADHLDPVRHLLVDEPRGHADMYGCFVTPPNDEGADLGVVFFHNEGYSTACGHGTIALVTWAIESGRLAPTSDQAIVTVDAPSGRLRCTAGLRADGSVRSVRFENVPSFAAGLDVTVETSRGPLTLDVGFGGAFYGSLDARTLGLRVVPAALPALIALQRELRPALQRAVDVVHPIEPELSGIYGVIFWEPDGGGRRQRNVTVFADGEVDRSPCGSGTSARLAIMHARGEIAVGDPFHHRSIVDSAFDAGISGTGDVAGRPAVHTWVEGSAFRTGEHVFVLDERDPLGTGFLLR
jgi:proline racemase